jgi:hypothetical protein
VSTYKPNAKTLPFVLLALLGILFIYDAGVEQEVVSTEIISKLYFYPVKIIPVFKLRKFILFKKVKTSH